MATVTCTIENLDPIVILVLAPISMKCCKYVHTYAYWKMYVQKDKYRYSPSHNFQKQEGKIS